MADEITYSAKLAFSKGGAAIKREPAAVTVNMTGDHAIYNVQEIGVAAENLVKGEVGTPGFVWVKNLDSANFVEIGYDDTGFKPTIKLLFGEWNVFRSAQATLQAKADTAPVDLEYFMVEA